MRADINVPCIYGVEPNLFSWSVLQGEILILHDGHEFTTFNMKSLKVKRYAYLNSGFILERPTLFTWPRKQTSRWTTLESSLNQLKTCKLTIFNSHCIYLIQHVLWLMRDPIHLVI
ncbi:hypothetical protein AMTRI_Chr08g162180 [Amborella trichopoda]